jgi:ATP-dependent Clp protease adapter protein ClpS
MEDGAMTQLMEAVHIDGDAVISFRGSGSARFRIQQTRDDHGELDALG